MTDSLAQRVRRLEIIGEIRDLKHRYLRACDAKDPDGYRSCFVTEGADLQYGTLGRFDTVDDLLATYRRIALHKHGGEFNVLDMHHTVHPTIEVLSETEATGEWTLRFRQVIRDEGVERLMCGSYHDRYVLEEDAWKIQQHHFRVLWLYSRPLPDGARVEQPGLTGA